MQDKWGNRAVRGVAAACAAVLSAATVAAVVGVEDPADADTVVTSAYAAAVVLPDGSQREAREGDRVPAGAQLRTGQAGGARLTTAGRDVYVGALSTVTVLDGVRERLDRGQVMVDARGGPQLDLAVGEGARASAVRTARGALTRVERGAVLRLGVFEGSGAVGVTGRQATVPVRALHQVTTQYGALPGTPTALVLTSDRWEQRLAGGLVSADEVLERLQAGLRGSEGRVVLASSRRDLVDATSTCPAAAADQGERALSVAIGQAARASGSPLEHLSTVCTARGEGGSWGVVAALVQAPVSLVSGQLDEALAPGDGSGPTVVAGPSGFPGIDLPGLPVPSASSSNGPGPRPTATRTPTSDPTTPSPSADPSLVDQVVAVVTRILPTPPVAVPTPAAPGPSPTPLLQVGGIRVG